MAGAKGQRKQTPDLLKGLAVILMIQVHIMELFTRQDIADGMAGKISLFFGGVPAAPVFMVIMGYFIAFRQKKTSEMVKRGARLFAAGMMLNVGLNAHLVYRVLFDGWGTTVNIWHYLFGADILHMAGLSLVVMGITAKLSKGRLIPYVALIVILLLIPCFIEPYSGNQALLNYLWAFVYSHAAWSYFPLLPWLVYPLIGHLFSRVEERCRDLLPSLPVRIILMGVLSIFVFFTLPYAAAITHDLESYYHHGAPFFFWAIAFMVWWSAVSGSVEQLFGETWVVRYVKWLGINVTTAYAFQWLIIGNLATSLYKTLPLHTAAIWFAVILIFTSVLTLTWNKIKKRYSINFLSV
jgi:uncharacterized membrane protein